MVVFRGTRGTGEVPPTSPPSLVNMCSGSHTDNYVQVIGCGLRQFCVLSTAKLAKSFMSCPFLVTCLPFKIAMSTFITILVFEKTALKKSPWKNCCGVWTLCVLKLQELANQHQAQLVSSSKTYSTGFFFPRALQRKIKFGEQRGHFPIDLIILKILWAPSFLRIYQCTILLLLTSCKQNLQRILVSHGKGKPSLSPGHPL